MTKNPLAIACSAGILFSFLSSAAAQTLQQAVHLMLKQEPELLAVNLDSESAFQDWKIARGDLFPQVTLNGSSGVSERDRSTDGLVSRSGDSLWANQVGLSVRQLLFDGGIVSNEARASSAFYDSQRYLQMSQIEARVVDLAEVYMEVIRVQRQLTAARENVSVHKEMREKLAERQRNGGVRADTSLIDGRLSLAENSLYTHELAMKNAEWRFARLTGVQPESLTEPAKPWHAKTFESLDLSQNWDFLAASAALDAADFKRKSKRGLYSPNVYLDAGASRGEDTLGVRGRDDEVRALLVLSWDLYRGGSNKATNQRERLQLAKAGELLRAAEQQREYQLRLALAEKEGSTASTGSLKQYADKLSRVIDDYEEQFRIGQKELLNILDVRNEHYQARSRLIDSLFNEDTGAYRILGIQGRLVQHLIGDSIADYVTVGNRKADKWYPGSPNATIETEPSYSAKAPAPGLAQTVSTDPQVETTVAQVSDAPASGAETSLPAAKADDADDEEWPWPDPFPTLKSATDNSKLIALSHSAHESKETETREEAAQGAKSTDSIATSRRRRVRDLFKKGE